MDAGGIDASQKQQIECYRKKIKNRTPAAAAVTQQSQQLTSTSSSAAAAAALQPNASALGKYLGSLGVRQV